MARINITLESDKIAQVLADSRENAFRLLLQEFLNAILSANSAEQLRAEPYEQTQERTDSRNETKVLRQRNTPFETLVFDNYKRKRGRPYDRDGRDGRHGRLYSEGGQGHRGGL